MEAKAREFEAPEEDLPPTKKSKKEKKDKEEDSSAKRPDIEDLKNKFLKKRKKVASE